MHPFQPVEVSRKFLTSCHSHPKFVTASRCRFCRMRRSINASHAYFRILVLKKSLTPAALLLCASMFTAIMPVSAYSAGADTENAQERINLSGKLRMLSQRIPSAACHLNRGIDAANATNILGGATAEFEQILVALELGDPTLNIIAPETRRKTLARIQELRDLWTPFQAAALALADGTADSDDLAYVMTENRALLGRAQLLVEELIEQYSNPNAATRASLMLIDIAGRQRMLTQKMGLETCAIGTEGTAASTSDDLVGTVAVFDASLEALRFGMPQVGINPPPNPAISAGLDEVLADWTRVKPLLQEVASGVSLDNDIHMFKYQQLDITMAGMNAVVGLYAQAAGS